ncbi:succinate dehydrogenase cytochrome b subunit [Luteibaculum oceani]|uniref:Succinate dehydrogenase cytochrome b subunit n=1 Tax=Luteibaculum oceani TaxID=1294296 RepID=A0A5C6V1A1_9FLAO|nr:succinate dehydrogenase cytochrome b subunit [Luteibaculum oceani]TXC78989.1 succinate dehydrogenase cytochrome b subunit [Luteibaculum oceani]
MAKSGLLNSSVGRKIAMALSALFLIIFLLQHLTINFTSVLSADVFNELSHFMGTNFIVQFVMQPILIIGVVFHFVMGFILEARNKSARSNKYAYNNAKANSAWASRNMLITGVVILLFLGLHFYDFWIPEIATKYVAGDTSGLMEGTDQFRYFEELQHKFVSPTRTGLYCLAFIALIFHLQHGFASAFQSVGVNNNKYTPGIKAFGKIYSIVVPLGFVVVALYHHFSHFSH